MIEKYDEIFRILSKQAVLLYESINCDMTTANTIVQSIISINYRKDTYFEDSTECFIFRGTDINEIKNGKEGNPPLRYIQNNNVKDNSIKPYDILIEISGGSPTQSTGRACILSESFLKSMSKNFGTSGFSRTIRCKNTSNAVALYLAIDNAYKKSMFFQYENGSNGIKNLNLTLMLSELFVKKLDTINYKKLKMLIDEAYEIFEKSRKLNNIKHLLLLKYF